MPIKLRTEGCTNYGLRGRAAGADTSGLKLIHVTSVGAAREILRAGQITVRQCKIFNRNLIYFFLLRPAYKLKGSREKRGLIDFFPFVFVLEPALLDAPFHVYPFDTGGAVDGAFDAAYSPWLPLEDYALEKSLQGAADHLMWAFDSRADYFDGRLKTNLIGKLPDWDSHGRTTLDIARLAAEGSNQPDLRASSIEVAYGAHVALRPCVEFAVLPRQFLEDVRGRNTSMIEGLTNAGINWETYDWRPNRPPEDFQREVNDIVRAWLVGKGVL